MTLQQQRNYSSMNGFVRENNSQKIKKLVTIKCFQSSVKVLNMGTIKRELRNMVPGKRHVCKINHYQSSGAVSIFSSSIKKYNVRYSHYIGNGDTKSLKKVAQPYGDDLKLRKLECLGHVQKRFGTRLRKLMGKGD